MKDWLKNSVPAAVVLVMALVAQRFMPSVAPVVPSAPAPAPNVVVVPSDIIGPTEPVPVGRFAKFEVKDIEQPQWEVFAKSDTLADPAFGPDSNGLSGYVETATEGSYRVAVRGLRDGKVVGFVTTLIVGKAPQPPPGPDAPPVVVVPPVDPDTKVTTVTYVYEKDETAIPSAVHAALNRLNRERGIVATVFEQNTFDGDDQVPDQYAAALAAAKEKGLPCAVALAGDKVVRTAKAPTTEAEVLEVAK